MLRILFFSSTKFGLNSLDLLNQKFNIIGVVTNNPKPSGRGKKTNKTPIHERAELLQLKVINSNKPTLSDIKEDFDIGIVISYGAIIKEEVLNKAKYGFLNIHPSDLPKFRGAAPIERTVESGDLKTRVCIIKMTPRLDDGNILTYQDYLIQESQNSLDLHDEFSKIGASLLPDAIEKLQNGYLGEEQNESNSTYATKITKQELELKHNVLYTKEAFNKVRAFTSYGFMFLIHQGKRVKILECEISKISKTNIDIKCLDGFLVPTLIKVEGKNVTQNYFTL
jgi:methionyl-tRNA formyltransferase